MAEQVELAAAALDEKRHLAGDEAAARGDQQPEIIALDMREQHVLARLGECGGR